jgi:hypothetical protein
MLAKARFQREYTTKSDTKAIQNYFEANDRTQAKKSKCHGPDSNRRLYLAHRLPAVCVPPDNRWMGGQCH